GSGIVEPSPRLGRGTERAGDRHDARWHGPHAHPGDSHHLGMVDLMPRGAKEPQVAGPFSASSDRSVIGRGLLRFARNDSRKIYTFRVSAPSAGSSSQAFTVIASRL